MKKLILTASALALFPATAQAQLLGGGGLGGSIGGSIGSTVSSTVGSSVGSTVESTTRSVRGTVNGDATTEGNQSVDAKNGRASANRSASGSLCTRIRSFWAFNSSSRAATASGLLRALCSASSKVSAKAGLAPIKISRHKMRFTGFPP